MFENDFETGWVVWVVERLKRKNGSKRSQEMMMMMDVSHRKNMPLAAGKNFDPIAVMLFYSTCA